MSEVHHEPQGHSVNKPEARSASASDDLREAVSSILGRPPSEYEVEEGIWYDALRVTLRRARADDKTSQGQIAERLKVAQSEVSRLETSVAPGTSLGRVRDYLRACGARINVMIVTRTGRFLYVGSTVEMPTVTGGVMIGKGTTAEEVAQSLGIIRNPYEPEIVPVQSKSPQALSAIYRTPAASMAYGSEGLLGHRVFEPSGELEAITALMLALDDAMQEAGLAPEVVAKLRRRVLEGANRRARLAEPQRGFGAGAKIIASEYDPPTHIHPAPPRIMRGPIKIE